MMNQERNYDEAVNAYVIHLEAAYANWGRALGLRDGAVFAVLHGDKYSKVVFSGPPSEVDLPHSFIVRGDDPKFENGDVLSPRSKTLPSRRGRLGNIFRPRSYRRMI